MVQNYGKKNDLGRNAIFGQPTEETQFCKFAGTSKQWCTTYPKGPNSDIQADPFPRSNPIHGQNPSKSPN